jgi:hypothetical protein
MFTDIISIAEPHDFTYRLGLSFQSRRNRNRSRISLRLRLHKNNATPCAVVSASLNIIKKYSL